MPPDDWKARTNRFLFGREEVKIKKHHSRRRRRRHHRSDSGSDMSEVLTDTNSSLGDNDAADPRDAVPRDRLAVPHRGRHKRTSSANSSQNIHVMAATTKTKTPYEQLWVQAEEDFRTEFESDAKRYDLAVEKNLNGSKQGPEKGGFQSTLMTMLRRGQKGKDSKVRQKMTKFLTVLTQISAPLGPLAGLDPTIAQPVWTGFCLVLKLCLNLSTKLQELLDNVEIIADILSLYSALEERYNEASSSTYQAPIFKRTRKLFSNILHFQAVAAHRLDLHIMKRGFLEAFAIDEWKILMDDIKKGDTACQDALLQYSPEKVLSTIRESRDALENAIKELNRREEKVVAWLSQKSATEDHNEIYRKSEQFRDRGIWFTTKIDRWMSGQADQSVYWLHGIYGMGKSFLISRVIDSIQKATQNNPEIQLAYFYFSENNNHDTPEAALRSLLAQLAILPDGSLAPSIDKLYNSKPATKLGPNECQKQIALLVEAQVQTIFVIDALDECSYPSKFLSALKNVVPKRKNAVKIIISSQEDSTSEIQRIFPSHSSTKLDTATNEKDIKHYVNIQVKSRESMGGSRLLQIGETCDKCRKSRERGTCVDCKDRQDIEERLVKLLIDKCHGMFTWVDLQLRIFFPPRGSLVLSDVERNLQNLRRLRGQPHLTQVYTQIMERNATGIEAEKLVEKAYKWLLYVTPPLQLSMKTLSDAVSVNSYGRIESNVDISNLCSNMVDSTDGRVHLSHPTMFQYLKELEDSKGAKIYSAEESHKEIATTCLRYLKNYRLERIPNGSFEGTPREKPVSFIEWKLRTYAPTFWPLHLNQVLRIHQNYTLKELANDIFFRKESYTRFIPWAELWKDAHIEEKLRKESKYDESKSDGQFATQFPDSYSLILSMLSFTPDPFFAACIFGLPDVCKKSEYSTSEKSQKRNLNHEPGVFLAIKSLRLDSLQMLVEQGVDVNSTWCEGRNALHCACIHGSLQMVKYLVEQGVDLASIDFDGATALHLSASSKRDPKDKITYLSGMGLDVNRVDAQGATVLHYAARSPKISGQLFRRLESVSIDFKVKDFSGETALHVAVKNPGITDAALQKLLDEVDVNAVGKKKMTALAYLVAPKSEVSQKYLASFLARGKPDLSVTNENGTVLHLAVKNTRFPVSLVEKLATKSIVNLVDKEGRTALHCAMVSIQDSYALSKIIERAGNIVRMLLNKFKANCNLTDKKGETALHALARCPIQPPGLMGLLLDKGGNATIFNNMKETALSIALRFNQSDSKDTTNDFKRLIDATGDLSTADIGGESLLHRASRNNYVILDVISLLFEAGVSINATDKTGSTAFHYAVEKRSIKTLQAFVDKGADPNLVDSQKSTALHRWAVNSSRYPKDIISFLIKLGLDVTALDIDERTPLMVAALLGTKRAVSAYIESQSIDHLAVDKEKNSILHLAVSNQREALEITKFLLKSKMVDVNGKNGKGETPLHLAARKSSSDVVKELLDAGAKCLVETSTGETPLHHAVSRLRSTGPIAKIIGMLIEANPAVREVKNNTGETALDLALKNRSSSISFVTILRNKAVPKIKNTEKDVSIVASDGKSALHQSAIENWIDEVDLLLEHKVDVNVKDRANWTPLCHAAKLGHGLVMKKLMGAGADVNLANDELSTALHLAAASGHFECVRLLLDKKAKMEEEDHYHRTPLWRAMVSNREHVSRLLLEYGANPNTKLQNGRTLLNRVAELGNISVARMLLEKGVDVEMTHKRWKTPLYQAIKARKVVMIGLLLDHGAVYSSPPSPEPEDFIGETPKLKLERRDALISRLMSEHK